MSVKVKDCLVFNDMTKEMSLNFYKNQFLLLFEPSILTLGVKGSKIDHNALVPFFI